MNAITIITPIDQNEPLPSTVIVPTHQIASIQRSWELARVCSQQMAVVTQWLEVKTKMIEQETQALIKFKQEILASSDQLIAKAQDSAIAHDRLKSASFETIKQLNQGAEDILQQSISETSSRLQALDAIQTELRAKNTQQSSAISSLQTAIANLH